MVKIAAIVFVFGLLLVGSVSAYYFNNVEEIKNKEDISSYQIKNRYECKQIQNDNEYNKCLKFYLDKDPYKLGEDLVPTRLTKK